ncbi:ABC transporter permease [Chitinimonas sp. BJB300]|uniref:ABC transporter permease n=1 Tax=Chitinimonas sp. BJB300 TaxID=1559339 RepID=UPI000C0FA6F2|nr:iron ABC transporter permease [Chitinimonas sp. BJB300]PHV11030.1 ABC transporter permease [Chitinimonas sp. BJB300]TSJ86062.1 iron ABC transporter permease [Chitinimonas sp. BJB300]
MSAQIETSTLPLRPILLGLRRGWDENVLAWLIAAITLLPLAVVLASLLQPQADIWAHLTEFVLPGLLVNTVWLVAGVGLATLALGVSLAWLTAIYDFPGRKYFSWALALPLAMPAYVLAFVQIGLYDFTGPVQTLIREMWGNSHWVPPIRSRGGVILTLTLALYPYVYLLARNAFQTQGRRALEAAASLGLSRRQGFWRVALPMARPWLVGGVTLALMECLADFGTVATFNYDTFTTAIYKAWFSLFNLTAASQLASLLVLMVFVLALMEQHVRGDKRYTASGRLAHGRRERLRGARGALAAMVCLFVLALAFLIPLAQLLWWAQSVAVDQLDLRYFGFIGRSLLLSAGAALLVVLLALGLAYAVRRRTSLASRVVARLATIGYAIPGTVLAVGVFIPIAWLDNRLVEWVHALGWGEPTQLIKGTLAVMLLAYVARFLAVAFEPTQSAMQRITASQEEAAASMGLGRRAVLRRIHLPMLRGGLLTAALMVFVDVMKEMPITLMTRPFGWDTLSVRVFEMTSEGQWEMAALPAVAIVLAGLIPVILLAWHTEKHT